MVSSWAKESDSKRIESVQVYRPKLALQSSSSKGRRIRLYNALFLIAYMFQGGWVISTIGEPYRAFLEKADREGFQVMEGSTRYRAELEHQFRDIDDEKRRVKKIGWFDWMDYDIEELAAEKKRDKERSVLDSLPKSMRVPSRYAAGFWPTLVLGLLGTFHALVLLMQHWRVGFNVWINYQEMDADQVEIPDSMMEVDLDLEKKHTVTAATPVPDRVITNPPSTFPTHARVKTAKGEDMLVGIEYYPTLGMTFEYHRRRYVYTNGVWSKIRCRANLPLHFFVDWAGFPSQHRVVSGQIRYGPNMFSVRQPSFMDLYKKQLLNPLSVFQVFCVLLWAIDDYLIYSATQLGMVLMFEAMVVFQRLKSMQALRGMGNPSRNVQVFRSGCWSVVDTTELLPGDIMSLTRVKPHRAKSDDDGKIKRPAKIEDEGGDIVPADLLLLRGSTVVNEASLTGESVPQMKEGLADLEESDNLDMKNRHKMNVAYAGTKMLQCKGAAELAEESSGNPKLYGQIPNPPDGGCVCFVLRTGFASAQGKLVRMIEGSQEKVKGHERETLLLLLLLCFFAVASSSYVLYHGMRDENRSKYELLLHCILIVTNVIRPELPMQMALAVNNSLMTLMKMHVFCTEPYRVPLAGKLDACLFDKTGTLTTDELVAVGVCEPPKVASANGKEDESTLLTPMVKVSGEAALVLAGCHSLVVVDGETAGDPLESEALKSMRWCLNETSGNAVPMLPTEKRPAPGNPIILKGGHKVTEVEILTRHHFSSKLQRMSCVIRAGGKYYAVAKGSPEAIGRLLASKPGGYEEKSQFLSKQGYRMISLAFKQLDEGSSVTSAKETRAACEENLIFAGFIAFTCMVRKDTADVLKRLKEGGMSVAMVTGDALLTAIHVAKEVDIFEALQDETAEEETNEELKVLLDSKRQQRTAESGDDATKPEKSFRPILCLEATDKGAVYWSSYDDGSRVEDFVAKDVPELALRSDLATTGKVLSQAYEYDPDTRSILQYIKVFARMTPDAKETVIECLHSVGALCMMCGDGANDVGALKQSDVGVALLTGFGNLNVDKGGDEGKEKAKDVPEVTAIISKEHLDQLRAMPVSLIKQKIKQLGTDPEKYPEIVEKEDLVKLYQIKARELAVKRHDEKNNKDKSKMTKAELAAEQRREMQERQKQMQAKVLQRTQELEAQGVSFAAIKAMKEVMGEEMKEMKKKQAGMAGVEGSAASLAAQFEDMDGGLPMVKLGDASVAAPFTSKMPSIRNCVDIVRQGRCTLVSTIQMYQIMALQCLISSYSLSVLYLDGLKYGDMQMTAMGILGSVSFLSVSRSKPLDKLSTVRPLNSIFHPALFVSLLGQFAIHMATMVLAVRTAKQHLPPDYKPDLDGMFQPGILNTVVFLVNSVQQVTIFVVNLQGRPFMTGLTENRPLLWSLAATFILTFMFASESVPGLNRYFQLVPFPEESFRDFVLTILAVDVVGSFLFDRLMQFFFCRNILKASVEGTTWKDVFYLTRTLVVIAFLMNMFMGDSDTWDHLIELEANLTSNATDELDGVSDSIAECVGDLCEAVNDTVNSLADEF